MHVRTTAQEISRLPDGIDALITGVYGQTPQQHRHRAAVAQAQVAGTDSVTVIRWPPAPPIQALAPDSFKESQTELLDGVIRSMQNRRVARRSAAEGMLVGISSGATLAAIAQKLQELPAGSPCGLQLRHG